MQHVKLLVNDTYSDVSDTILLIRYYKCVASFAKARNKDDQKPSKGLPF